MARRLGAGATYNGVAVAVEDAAPPADSSPERQLAAAVLARAILDRELPGYEGRMARKFLLEESGPYARHRVLLCEIAGMDPDVFVERARGLIA